MKQLIPPPAQPSSRPTEQDWIETQARLGLELPPEWKAFLQTYGAGTFRGSETTALSIYSAGNPSFAEDVSYELERFREIRGDAPTADYPFRIFPEPAGLYPLGIDECDVWICWKCSGAPQEWPIAVRWTWGEQGIRTFDLPLSTFLVRLFERTLELPCWPEPTFLDDVKFVPYPAAAT
ncbi:SMI1/KNR4 family protein [Blastopirellula marina]|uniref:SMI1/KNR4 family protein n=1 Tax=Blastopirellula marina TaxID=124 RepID=UPI0013048D8D|nr:SMI1/KNR4 family protein [Blastopirellula marina]